MSGRLVRYASRRFPITVVSHDFGMSSWYYFGHLLVDDRGTYLVGGVTKRDQRVRPPVVHTIFILMLYYI